MTKFIATVGGIACTDGCLIMGDFNLPGVDFGTFSVDGADDSFAAQVFDCVMDNYLSLIHI